MDSEKNRGLDTFVRVLESVPSAHPFGSDRAGEKLYQRAEKIAAAILLLTRHLPASEPLREQARSLALSLLPLILEAPHEAAVAKSLASTKLMAHTRHLISLLRLMVIDGLVAQANAEAVTAALNELHAIGLMSRPPVSDEVAFYREDFADTSDKRHIKDIKDVKRASILARETGAPDRKDRIITILREGGEQNIRDIATKLPEYGEKTIQRELGALMSQGIVRRAGLKRWSRYSLEGEGVKQA